jgi:hypothetical protein
MENFECGYGIASAPAYQQQPSYQQPTYYQQPAQVQHFSQASHFGVAYNPPAPAAHQGYNPYAAAPAAHAAAASAAPPKRGVRWGQNEYRVMTPQPADDEDEASPTSNAPTNSLFSLAFGGAMPQVGAFAPGGGFGGFGSSTAQTSFAQAPDTREACAPISQSRLVQRRWKNNSLGVARR